MLLLARQGQGGLAARLWVSCPRDGLWPFEGLPRRDGLAAPIPLLSSCPG